MTGSPRISAGLGVARPRGAAISTDQAPLAVSGGVVSGVGLFEQLLEFAPDAIVGVSGDGRIVLVNARTEELFGIPRGELLGEPLELLVPERLRDAHRGHRGSYLGDPRPRPMGVGRELWGRRRDGSEFLAEIQLSSIETDAGVVALAAIRDVTARKATERELAAARKQLQASEERYRSLFEHNPQPLVAYDRQTLEIIAVSDTMATTFGYSRRELESTTLSELVLPEDIDTLREYLEATPGGTRPGMARTPAGYPSRRRRKDGSVIEVEVASESIVLAGRPCRLALYTDVTERNRTMRELEAAREQLSANEQNYRLLFEQNPLPLVVYDRETLALLYVSDAMVAKYGYSREQLLTMRVTDLVPVEDIEPLCAYIASTPDGSLPDYARLQVAPNRHQLKDGTVIEIEATSNPIELGGRPCRYAFFDDVTARNRAAAELQQARDAALDASRTKSAFLANMSHEIRTPMNAVIGLTELLLDSDLNDDQRQLATMVGQAGEHLLELINDILDISKIEAGKVTLNNDEFELRAMIHDASELVETQAHERGLRFDVRIHPAVPARICGDQTRIRQVLLNLLTNAVKFTTGGGITVTLDTTIAGRLRFEVADTGCGISPDQLQAMFERFTQADPSTTRASGGAGLGLAISRGLVELMHGTIGAHSQPGHGSTFWFELPPETTEPTRKAAQTTARPQPPTPDRHPHEHAFRPPDARHHKPS